MSKQTHQVLAVCCTVALLIGAGCAKKEVVRSEEPINAKPAPVNTAPAKPAQAAPDKPVQAKTETLKPISVTPVKGSADQTAKASAMQARFEKIYFNFDSSDLGKDARESLAKNAETMMKVKPDAKVIIEGNCDERGSAEYNLALGERRAKAAAKYMTTLGVNPERLATVSYGKERPAVQGDDEAAWAKNRRDEFVIQK